MRLQPYEPRYEGNIYIDEWGHEHIGGYGPKVDPLKDTLRRKFWWETKWLLTSPRRRMGLHVQKLSQPIGG